MEYEHELADDRGQGAGARDTGSPNAKGPKGKQQRRVLTKRAPRPKLTLELLKQPQGFLDVFNNFPKYFANGFKGKGHEVRDLRRLLELYQRWACRIFPSAPFDEVVEKLEKMSGSMQLRAEMRELRQGLRRLVDADEHAEQQQEQEQEQQAGNDAQEPDMDVGDGGRAQGNSAGAGAGGHATEDPDDEELLQLQQEAEWDAIMEDMPEAFDENDVPAQKQAAAPATRRAPAQTVGGYTILDDDMLHDELLNDLMAAGQNADEPAHASNRQQSAQPLLEKQQPQPQHRMLCQQQQQQQQHQQRGDADEEADDAELLELARTHPMQGAGSMEDWLYAAPPAHTAGTAGPSSWTDDDDDDDDQPIQPHGAASAAATPAAAPARAALPASAVCPQPSRAVLEDEDDDDDDELLQVVAKKKRPRRQLHADSSDEEVQPAAPSTGKRRVPVQGLDSGDEEGSDAAGADGHMGWRRLQRGVQLQAVTAGMQQQAAGGTAAPAAGPAALAAATAEAKDSDDDEQLLGLARSQPAHKQPQQVQQGPGAAAGTVLPSLALELGTELPTDSQ